MPDRRCCCLPCLIGSDLFDRADNDTVEGWTEIDPNWRILSNQLREDGNYQSTIVFDIPHPRFTSTGRASVEMVDIQEGKAYSLLLAYEDEDNWLGGTFIAGADGWGTIQAVERSGGVTAVRDSYAVPYTPGETDTLDVCISSSGIFVGKGSATSWAWACLAYEHTGRKAALRNSSLSSAVDFDNFYFWQHLATNYKCPGCGCDCNGYCVPKTLTLTITAVGSCADCIDGETITLTYDPAEQPEFVWKGNRTLCHWSGEGTTDYIFEFHCGEDVEAGCIVWHLHINDTGGCAPGIMCLASTECDPVELVFEPYICSGSAPPDPPPQCTLTFTVTE